MNQDMKYGYLDETYETICPLGEQDIFLAKNRDNGRIFVKKYVAASVIPVYEKLIAIRNEHLENIYDFAAGEERGILITGYISGISVQQYLEYYGVFAEERVKDYMADILEVLGQVHALGIVHRDITAGNIMISDDGIVKLIDFGIAREVKKEQGKDTVVLGTVGYAAPEQFGFHQSDARTDLYAVGVLCNEMLTGKLPGDGLYNGSQNMQKIILKATAIDAKQRFQTADEMRRALATKKRKQKLSEILLPLPGFRTGKTWKKVTACLGYAFWGIYSIGSIAECNKNTSTMLLEALSLGIYLWLPMAVLTNYGSWNQKIYPFSRMPVAAKIILELVLSLVFFVGGYAIENYLRVDVMHIVGK